MKIEKKNKFREYNYREHWKDSYTLLHWSILSFYLLFLFFLIAIIIKEKTFGISWLLLIPAYLIYIMLYWLFRGRTILEKDGIWIGNSKIIKSWENKPDLVRREKRIFIPWNKVKSIKFQNKAIYGYAGTTFLHTFISIKLKNDKKIYFWHILDYKGAIKYLEKIKKFNLLTKDSRYK